MTDKASRLLGQAQALADGAQRQQWPAFRGYWEMAERVLADATGEIEATEGLNSKELLGPLEFLLSAHCWAGNLAEAEEAAHRLTALTIALETNRADRLVRIFDHMAHAYVRYGNAVAAQLWRSRKERMLRCGGAFFG